MNLFKRIFGRSGDNKVIEIIDSTLEGILSGAGLDLSFEIRAEEEETYTVELFGEDEELLKEKDGQLLDAIQFFAKRVVQHKLPESRVRVLFDSNGYRDEANQALIELAEKLKNMVIEKQKSVYCKALPPKDRRIVHQHLSTDERIKTRSIGEGHYKKIKIFPANGAGGGNGGGGGNNRRGRRGTGPRREEQDAPNGNR